jgi:hypothetical protein
MIQIVNVIGYSVTFIIVISLLAYIVKLRKILSDSLDKMLEVTIKNNILMDELEKALKKIEEKPVESSDGFIKFMTDSREAAFSFISEIQDAAREFRNDIAEIENSPKKSKDTKIMLEAFSKLEKKILPTDIPNN